ncbi:MAG: carboxypeptidase-like regulatory domain-containing protein [Bacteroidota bacterium]
MRNIHCFGLFILLMLGSFAVLAQPNLRVELSYSKVSLEQVLLDLERQYALNFSYDPALIQGHLVNVSIPGAPIDEALTALLAPFNIQPQWKTKQKVLLIPRPGQGSTIFKLCGTLIDGDTREPIIGGTVQIRGTDQGNISNLDGYFEIPGLSNPEGQIEINYLGYQTRLFKISDLRTSECSEIEIWPETRELRTVIVKDFLTEGIAVGSRHHENILDPSRMKTLPGLVEPDVLLMAQMLPGVASADESATGINVRGGTPDQNLILFDDIPIYNSGHFFGMISAFNPYIIDQVDVYRSGFDASLGGRVSSVIDIRSEDDIPDRSSVGLGANFTHWFAQGKVPFANDRAAVIVSYRRSLTDLFQSPTYNSLFNRVFQLTRIDEQVGNTNPEENQATVDFFYYDLNVKAIWKPNLKDQFSVSLLTAFNKLDYQFDDFENELFTEDLLDLENGGFSFKWERDWNKQWRHETLLTASNYRSVYGFELGVESQEAPVYDANLDNELEDWNFSNTFKLLIDGIHTLEFGYQYDYKDLRLILDYQSTIEDDFFDQFLIDGGAHITHFNYHYDFGPLKAVIGVRSSYLHYLEEFYLEPRIHFSYQSNANMTWHLSGGWYTQFVSQLLEASTLEVNDQFWVLADNEGVPVIQSRQLNFGGNFTYGALQFSLEA